MTYRGGAARHHSHPILRHLETRRNPAQLPAWQQIQRVGFGGLRRGRPGPGEPVVFLGAKADPRRFLRQIQLVEDQLLLRLPGPVHYLGLEQQPALGLEAEAIAETVVVAGNDRDHLAGIAGNLLGTVEIVVVEVAVGGELAVENPGRRLLAVRLLHQQQLLVGDDADEAVVVAVDLAQFAGDRRQILALAMLVETVDDLHRPGLAAIDESETAGVVEGLTGRGHLLQQATDGLAVIGQRDAGEQRQRQQQHAANRPSAIVRPAAQWHQRDSSTGMSKPMMRAFGSTLRREACSA